MAIKFNVDEVLEMAERIEENGAAFYHRAAELHAGKGDVGFLTRLAEMEEDHMKTFTEMRKAVAGAQQEQTSYDPFDEQALYLQAMADGHGGEGDPKFRQALTGNESMESILLTAIVLEKKSINFYESLKDFVPARLGGEKIQVIIDEERDHMVTLAKEVKALRY